jgi:hypothetical protein
MSEMTVAMPLSGEEVIDAVLDRLRQKLQRDCFLSRNMAYESFDGSFMIELRLKDNGRVAEVQTTVNVSHGESAKNQKPIVVAGKFNEMAPNDVRQHANLPIPTVVDTQEGKREMKSVKYARPPQPAQDVDPGDNLPEAEGEPLI